MILTDKIYGTFTLKDVLVEELTNSPSFQRLKGVYQNSLPPRYLGTTLREFTKAVTRFDHCIGVFLLLRKLGATYEEQIAGLLHDVSHMAFSHAYDWIMEDYQKSDDHVYSQDARHVDFVKSTDLYEILKKHNLDADKIIHHTDFKLLDSDVPELCADRIDYFLREFDKSEASQFISSLTVYKNQIIFREGRLALEFAKSFLARNRENWASYESASRFHILARTMRYAMKKGYVVSSDFVNTDDFVLSKIESVDDEFIKSNLAILSMDTIPVLGKMAVARTKFRYVDPLFWRDGRIVRLSADNIDFAKMVDEQRKIYEVPISVFDG